MKILDWRGRALHAETVMRDLPRSSATVSSVLSSVQSLFDEIHKYGELAIKRQILEFDEAHVTDLKVSKKDLAAAEANMDPKLRMAMESSIERLRKVALEDLPHMRTVEVIPNGNVSTRFVPIRSVGIYAPGGRAAYPSSVIMNAVPAQIAGVKNIALFSPPQSDTGLPHASVLAAASILGINNVYAVGGAAGIYLAGYGLEEAGIHAVDMIVGPGNIYVTAAKRLVSGLVGIDSEAGPTEIMIIADDSCNPEFVARDLVSQAEHDENAACVCVTTSLETAQAISRAASRFAETETNSKRIKAALAGSQSSIAVVERIEDLVTVANIWGAEHLSIQVADPYTLVPSIDNAGAIFIGDYSPVSLGDYMAGSNHVLPTSNHSRFRSGLTVRSFLKSQEIVDYSDEALAKSATMIDILANAEGLPAHSNAVKARQAAQDTQENL